ncbi:DUF5069 domain-containing protein [Roseibacillus ishigakijimensis]|uniref:DUF5069 domain-containing protein n=1 Tax=Roseibacillus ishigakijimensis TaxID=454146 RepID=A0A934VLA0_9BACT|nr:DUF5069 domain-containing protein [Roseibacillus ishigakijimensis]MBK1833012.1 DUF5069 domain-containing protein [Roseibacillus ishigakijimensis]
MPDTYPCSPREELDGLPYFPRLCGKIRLFAAGELHPDLHANLGKGMDLWTCQFLGVSYETIRDHVLAGASDDDALAHARAVGKERSPEELAWFRAYLLTRGFRDDLAEKLASRLAELNRPDTSHLLTFCDYIDADEGRL